MTLTVPVERLSVAEKLSTSVCARAPACVCAVTEPE